jgi:AFG3 family protein
MKISIDAPDIKGRVQIFNLYLAKIKLADPEDLPNLCKKLAALTPGFTGADIANVVNEVRFYFF